LYTSCPILTDDTYDIQIPIFEIQYKNDHDKKIANLKYFYPLALIVGDARQRE
tara:strand:+ start:732 stop:890 length:159 start_codon:yes stop_codon:yes gene_type:complete